MDIFLSLKLWNLITTVNWAAWSPKVTTAFQHIRGAIQSLRFTSINPFILIIFFEALMFKASWKLTRACKSLSSRTVVATNWLMHGIIRCQRAGFNSDSPFSSSGRTVRLQSRKGCNLAGSGMYQKNPAGSECLHYSLGNTCAGKEWIRADRSLTLGLTQHFTAHKCFLPSEQLFCMLQKYWRVLSRETVAGVEHALPLQDKG